MATEITLDNIGSSFLMDRGVYVKNTRVGNFVNVSKNPDAAYRLNYNIAKNTRVIYEPVFKNGSNTITAEDIKYEGTRVSHRVELTAENSNIEGSGLFESTRNIPIATSRFGMRCDFYTKDENGDYQFKEHKVFEDLCETNIPNYYWHYSYQSESSGVQTERFVASSEYVSRISFPEYNGGRLWMAVFAVTGGANNPIGVFDCNSVKNTGSWEIFRYTFKIGFNTSGFNFSPKVIKPFRSAYLKDRVYLIDLSEVGIRRGSRPVIEMAIPYQSGGFDYGLPIVLTFTDVSYSTRTFFESFLQPYLLTC